MFKEDLKNIVNSTPIQLAQEVDQCYKKKFNSIKWCTIKMRYFDSTPRARQSADLLLKHINFTVTVISVIIAMYFNAMLNNYS